MKIDRMIGILIILLRRKRVQARELAEMFDVSIRTIYRDIEAINLAGIPIVTYQGSNGGISITEGYKLDQNVLTNREMATIITALNSVSTADVFEDTMILKEKLKSVVPSSQMEALNNKTQQFLLDFSPWGNETRNQAKIEQIREAIEELTTLGMVYCDANGKTEEREIEPHTLVLKGQKWYLYAYCRKRSAFRIFKVSRIKTLHTTDCQFTRREVALEERPWDKEWGESEPLIHALLRFDRSLSGMVEEWFAPEYIVKNEHNQYIVSLSVPDGPWIEGYVLSFGKMVEVLEPVELRNKVKRTAAEICALYEE